MYETRLSGSSRKDALFEGLFRSIKERYDEEDYQSFHDWVSNPPVILDGKPFTFTGHE
jgi:hypothetical protein